MGLHLAAALKVLFNGQTVVQVPLGETIDVYTDNDGYTSKPMYFRSCKDAFNVVPRNVDIRKVPAVALPDGRVVLTRQLRPIALYEPPPPDPA